MDVNALIAARRRAGLSIAEAARRARMFPEALHRLEAGGVKNPTIGTLQKLAAVYGCTVNDFLGPAA